MTYQDRIVEVKAQLISEIENSDNPRAVLRSSSLRELYSQIKTIDISERKAFGQAVNQLKQDLETKIAEIENAKLTAELPAIDVTAPFDSNTAKKPKLLRAENGSIHPINQELSRVLDIFGRMGFRLWIVASLMMNTICLRALTSQTITQPEMSTIHS